MNLRTRKPGPRLARLLGGAALLCTATAAIPAEGEASAAAAQQCRALADLQLEEGKVLDAKITQPGDSFPSDLPAFISPERLPIPPDICRVWLHLSGGEGSSIRAELWLPLARDWNGKMVEAGNGGFGGGLSDPMITMRHAVRRGYAAAGNDMGHMADDPSWFGREPAVIDYAWRADRVTSLATRKVLDAFYGKPARLHYFEGCSSGGRQALMAANAFPQDYDGIVAGAPVSDLADSIAEWAWQQKMIAQPGARPSMQDLQLVGAAARTQCDAEDGLADGLISDPQSCHFDPAQLQCKAGQTDQCLTPEKIAFLRKVYRGPGAAKGIEGIPGLPPGAEAMPDGWHHWITKPDSRGGVLAQGTIGRMMRGDPAWTFDEFDLARDLPQIRKWFAAFVSSPIDLAPFAARGGRAVTYHGWADAGVNPNLSVRMWDRLVAKLGREQTDAALALFMVPGLSHCAGGPGPGGFQMLDALDAWRDRGVVPQSVIGRWQPSTPYAELLDLPPGPVTADRPICRYPLKARWDGHGDPKRAASFTCG